MNEELINLFGILAHDILAQRYAFDRDTMVVDLETRMTNSASFIPHEPQLDRILLPVVSKSRDTFVEIEVSYGREENVLYYRLVETPPQHPRQSVYSSGAKRDASHDKPNLMRIDRRWLIAVRANAYSEQYRNLPASLNYDLFEHIYALPSISRVDLKQVLLNQATMMLHDEATLMLHDDEDGFDYNLLLRLAMLQTYGANRYGVDNWKKGMPLKATYESLLRHVAKLLAREPGMVFYELEKSWAAYSVDESSDCHITTDNTAAVLFNLQAMWYTLQHYADDRELCDWWTLG